MARDWAKLGGDRGKPVKTSSLGRALKLGSLATRMSGSFIKRQIKRIGSEPNELDSIAGAAMDNVRQMVEVMGEMKGAAMKIGQLLSTDPDIVDSSFAERLATLQREAPPMDYVSLSQQVEDALDLPIDQLFSFFDPEPIGSASIGQVHRATLTDGRDVAVKIQYPGIVQSIDSDMNTLRRLLRLGRVFMTKERAEDFVAEARRTIMAESDYTNEAANLTRFRDYFADWSDIRIPEPILEYTRPTVLVMEFIDGVPFDDGVEAIEDAATRDAICKRFLEVFVYMFHELHELHADPHPGNFMLDGDNNIVLLDFGCTRDFSEELADGMLKMLRCVWDDDMETLSNYYRHFRFGREGMEYPDAQTLRDYHAIILQPMIYDGDFRFSDFELHGPMRQFLVKHGSLMKMVPPAELLLYFRVLAGLKGMMTRVDCAVNIRQLAEACCERRGI